MKRPLRPEEARLWSVVTATVRPTSSRVAAEPVPAAPPTPVPAASPAAASAQPALRREPLDLSKLVIGGAVGASPASARLRLAASPSSKAIEPGRRRRIVRGRDEIAARLDLHGLDQDRARSVLLDFLRRAQDEGARSVLVITGKGLSGQGVLRRRAPEWLADPALRTVVAGLSPADVRHGGEGAFYIALKRKPR